MTKNNHYVLGVDIGGVIIDRSADNSDTSFFSKNYLLTPAVPGAFAALAELRAKGLEIHLVSKCGETVQGKTLKWLARHDFYQATGISPEDVHFCRRREDKAPIAKTIGVTHFVDDRLEVLSYLDAVPHLYLINAIEEEVRQFQSTLDRVTRVKTWDELVRMLTAILNAAHR